MEVNVTPELEECLPPTVLPPLEATLEIQPASTSVPFTALKQRLAWQFLQEALS